MTTGTQRLTVMLVVFALGCMACSDKQPSKSSLAGTDAFGGLPVNPRYASSTVTGKACTQELLTDPLQATLRIDLESPERVWLVELNGLPKHVLWPMGFRLVSEPVPLVLAPNGASWRDGSPIEFPSVNRQTATGTPEKPLTVFGWIGGDVCYTSM